MGSFVKEMKALNLEELTVEQKLGMVLCCLVHNRKTEEETEANIQYVLNLAKNHSIAVSYTHLTLPTKA